MDHAHADVNGVRLHYVTVGRGPLVMFLHGFPEFWYAWTAQLADFGRDHRAVAPDMRGYNLSSKPTDLAAYAMKHLVADVRALAEHLGAKTVRYMLTFRSAQAERILSADDYARMLAMFTRVGAWFTDEDRAQYVAAWSQPGALTGGLNYYRAAGVGPPGAEGVPARSFGGEPSRLTLTVPTLVIWGERDRALLTGNLDGLERFVPDLTVERVPDGSHWVVHEQPALVNRLIREFLAKESPR